jgi:hypothetical protein
MIREEEEGEEGGLGKDNENMKEYDRGERRSLGGRGREKEMVKGKVEKENGRR